jgi:DNA-binding NtrC family response regulator
VVTEARTGAAALTALDGVDVILSDVRLPDMDGLTLLRTVHRSRPDIPVILSSENPDVEHAVAVMQQGAFHYVRKPVDVEEFWPILTRALSRTPPRTLPSDSAAAPNAVLNVIGESPAIRHLTSRLERIACTSTSTVLLTGESGTGKDLLARTIHAQSARAAGPFVNITCSALPDTLLESELFGHERGAFTDARQPKKGLLEQAAGGTVFLDEIGETSLALQAKLLRFLEDKSFRRVGGVNEVRPDVRIIAATNQDLADAMRNGRFREDLFYRLAVVHVVVPPLRERSGDLHLLAWFFIARFNDEFGKRVTGLTSAALEALERHPWPGNVRELRNSIERAMLFTDGAQLDVADFSGLSLRTGSRDTFELPLGGLNLRELERDAVAQALARAKGNRTHAAALLGLNRDQIRYRIEKFGLTGSGDEATTAEPASQPDAAQ